MGTKHEENRLEYDETELRLGLPGGGNEKNNGCLKRGFSQTLDLKLNLNATMVSSSTSPNHQLVKQEEKTAKPPAKVGWPPVRSSLIGKKRGGGIAAAFVKVSLDGAPYLRKVDLKMYNSYKQLSDALGKMFTSFTIGDCGSEGVKDLMSESKLIDFLNGSDYVPTYEDKDGDWMLVGDVPWEMFVDSCKRLRIMNSSEAIGLAPRAVEKCKNRV